MSLYWKRFIRNTGNVFEFKSMTPTVQSCAWLLIFSGAEEVRAL